MQKYPIQNKPIDKPIDKNNNKLIDISNLQSWSKLDKEWLEITLNDLQSNPNKKDKIIVATHYLPSMKLILPTFQNTNLKVGISTKDKDKDIDMDMDINASFQNLSNMKYYKGFASNLDHLIPLTNLWLFGHTHYHVDTILDKTRCYANPLGYPDEKDTRFSMSKIIELV